MARKTMEVRILAGTAETNRDYNKVFVITEMSAMDAERWASDALQGLTRSGVELPDDFKNAGTMAIASLGLRALGGMPGEMMQNLMDRMMACVEYYPDPNRREIRRPVSGKPPFADDVEEISTLVRLRTALFELQTGFSLADVKSLAAQKAPALS